ncbi:hypothetical protein BVC80_1453g18 [Macleaya cordata]|uniref:Uncharacterized protein n=1 Tax=Macleaya cordata TaxID=56857 RepID=A0A200PPF9_MACCD|nr:hypothetical protein BVC80_1453g18 [Macleaya cordata]
MSSLTDNVVNSLADEARHCLTCATSETPPPPLSSSNDDDQIPITKSLMNNNQQLALHFLYENRLDVLSGITKTVTNVCSKVFDDIIHQAFSNAAAVATVPPPTSPERVFPPTITETGESSFRQSNLNPMAEPWVPKNESTRERTMFITFSRGYPISAMEVRDFFVRSFGDCVEAIHMQEVDPNEQPLYARLILRSTSIIPLILDGKERVKFVLDGRHMRVRRFVQRIKSDSNSNY